MSGMSGVTWTRAYRLTLHLLPAGLRRKHGPAMEALFARELEQARARGRVHGALAGAAGVWDVIRRGAYEQLRPERDPAREPWMLDARGPQPAGARLTGSHTPSFPMRALLRRHAASFALAFGAFTASLLALFATRRIPALSARGAPVGTIADMLLLAVPFAALTSPMAVLVAVLREFTRLGADGTLAAARRERGGVRRLVVPVLGATVGVAALAFVVTAEIVPRANARFSAVLAGRPAFTPSARSDREMTVGELRATAREARADAGPHAPVVAAGYEVEIQKKYALPAACVVMALVGVALAILAPRGGATLVLGASGVVFGTYYVVLVTGEDLASRLVVHPVVGMWGANALMLAATCFVLCWRRATPASRPS
jgi:lipopolysaccharide export LptBFGC system permease protein LptF